MPTVVIDILGIVLLILGVVVLAVAALWSYDKLADVWARLRAPVQTEGTRDERLRQADWTCFRERFGCDPPARLCGLHADRSLLRGFDFVLIPPGSDDPELENWPVQEFTPIDAEAFAHGWSELDEDLLEIASDGFGNVYLVRITGDPDDPLPVLFYQHDGDGELEPVADSIDEFLSWPRRPADA